MGVPEKSSSNRKPIATSIFVFLFFAMCIFQAYGEQETWPFSFFGMYKRNVSRYNVNRADVEVTTSEGKVINVFNLGVNGYYLEENFRKILNAQKDAHDNPIDLESETGAATLIQQSPGVVDQLTHALREDIVPILEKNRIDPNGVIRVRFRLWREFELSRRFDPDIDEVFVEKRWKDL